MCIRDRCHSIQTKQCPPPPSPNFFTSRMPFLPPSQQCQSTEGNYRKRIREKTLEFSSVVLPAPSPYLPHWTKNSFGSVACHFHDGWMMLSKPTTKCHVVCSAGRFGWQGSFWWTWQNLWQSCTRTDAGSTKSQQILSWCVCAHTSWCQWGKLLWSPYVIGQTIIFSSCFFFFFFFPRLISAVGDWMSTIHLRLLRLGEEKKRRRRNRMKI